jgi:hypothetical protein
MLYAKAAIMNAVGYKAKCELSTLFAAGDRAAEGGIREGGAAAAHGALRRDSHRLRVRHHRGAWRIS